MYRIEFWQDLLIGGELGGVCRCSSCVFSIVSTKFHLDREHRLLYEFSGQKLMLLRSRGYLGEIESAKTKVYNFSCTFFFAFAVLRQVALLIFKS